MPFPDGSRWCAAPWCMLPVRERSCMCDLHHRVDRDEAARVLGVTREELDAVLLRDDSLRIYFGRRGRTASLHSLEEWRDARQAAV